MKLLVLGSKGFLGQHLVELLIKKKIEFSETSLSLGLDLRNRDKTIAFFNELKPDVVINCASYVGGIQFGYTHSAELFHNNLLINTNIFEAVHLSGVKRLINPIPNCVYPAKATLFREDELWDGPMHESVMVYGFVRKAMIMGAWAYHKQYGTDVVNIIMSNMYGPGDHFEEVRSHAMGALIMKFVKAKINNEPFVTVWGTGSPVREWLYVMDAAEALMKAINIEPCAEPINVGIASGISIKEMAFIIKEATGYTGDLKFDTSKPDGAFYKTVDGTKGEEILKWKPTKDFREGIKETVEWFLKNKDDYIK
jgi:GDP-L-fucose synthase